MSIPVIFPSLADNHSLKTTIKQLDAHCQGYHIDAMDGVFVPQKTWEPAAINTIEQETLRQLWVHLMVADTKKWLDELTIQASSIVTIHLESNKDIRKTILRIKNKYWLPSMAINPKTNLDVVFPFLADVHQVLLMSVEPGFSGQEFLNDTISKLDTLIGYRQTSGLTFKIAMDGGINKKNIGMLAAKGVDHFGVSSGIFREPDPATALRELQEIVTRATK